MEQTNNFSNEEIDNFIKHLKQLTEVDFTNYAPQSFRRRLEHLISIYNLDNLDDLLVRLKKDERLQEKCVNDITVNTTEMFRDVEVWQKIKKNIISKLEEKPSVNIWHAGCSTGEEVYSMLILLNEANLLDRVKVFATDINTDVLDRAKEGIYETRQQTTYFENFDKAVKQDINDPSIITEIPYSKYFDIDGRNNRFQVRDFLRKKVIFRQNNLIEGEVFYKFDLIFCRNVIIYFNSDLQNHVITLFHNSLFDDGLLLIGAHESIGYIPIASRFKNIIMRGLYQKKLKDNY